MNQEQLIMILSNFMNQYVFNKIFQDNNNGKKFDMEKWFKDAEKQASEDMFFLSAEKQKKFVEQLGNLDNYIFDSADDGEGNKPVLKLV